MASDHLVIAEALNGIFSKVTVLGNSGKIIKNGPTEQIVEFKNQQGQAVIAKKDMRSNRWNALS